MKAIAYIRFVREFGQALVPYAVIACMAFGVKALAAPADPEVVKMLRAVVAPIESQVRANSIRIGALEQEWGDRDGE